MYLTENLQEKWQPVLEHPDLPKIGDAYKRAVTTVILENQEKAVREDDISLFQDIIEEALIPIKQSQRDDTLMGKIDNFIDKTNTFLEKGDFSSDYKILLNVYLAC